MSIFSVTSKKTSIIIRLSLLIFVIPLGAEIALRIWLYQKQNPTIQNSLPNRPLLIAMGDSVTQQGYALEIGRAPHTPYPRENVVNYGKSGARIRYVVDMISSNATNWQNMDYQIVIMVGHNDCRYLQHLAVLGDDDPDYVPYTKKPWNKLALYRFYQEITGMSTLQKRYQVVNSPRASSRNGNSDRSMCLENLQMGFEELLHLRERYELNIALMTYPIPKSALEYALNPQVKSKFADFVSVNWLVNRETQKAAVAYQFPLIDAAECMKNEPEQYWHPDGLHLKYQGSVAQSSCMISFFQSMRKKD